MEIRVRSTELFIHNLRTRMPFRYGITTMTRVPHAFLRVDLEIDGHPHSGMAADHLPPKWFTKDPEMPVRQEVADLLLVIQHACELARTSGPSPSIFELWQGLYAGQRVWGNQQGFPPLLWGFGVSLVERATIDAFCRQQGVSFARAVRENRLGLQLGVIYPELAGTVPADGLPARPLECLISRHTVGLSDPLTESEIPVGERVEDGLPQSLEASLEADGLTHLKIKLCGDIQRDRLRLHRIVDLLKASDPECAFTLDGNENYKAVAPFRHLWESFREDPTIAGFLDHLIFVEQPFHRDVALAPDTAGALLAWRERPPIIIDESDAEIGTLATALACGYVGTSHKNCKGVFKGIANTCLIAARQRANPSGVLQMSAEDLSNVGPVALLQDLAVVATLGITHAERNGHHYFAGLSQFPRAAQEAILAQHGDLYTRHASGYPMVDIRRGSIAVGSVVAAPFGYAIDLDTGSFIPAAEWDYDSLEG